LLKYSYVHITGTGGNYGGALEFGIKLPEAVNIPVIANDTGSALHGAWGFLDEKWLNIFLVSDNDFEISQKILTLSKNYQGSSLIITQENLRKKIIGEMELRLPDFPDPLTVGLYYLFPLQLLVYHWAISTGQNPDVPKGLDHMLKAILPDGRQEPEFRK
jgi:fructoselysine-6-P-deglycase FrlB-like protein